MPQAASRPYNKYNADDICARAMITLAPSCWLTSTQGGMLVLVTFCSSGLVVRWLPGCILTLRVGRLWVPRGCQARVGCLEPSTMHGSVLTQI
jgi:hypothetical protein